MFKSNAFIVLKKNYHGKLSVSLIISLNIIYVEYNFVCKFDTLVDEFNFFFINSHSKFLVQVVINVVVKKFIYKHK